MFRLNCPVQSYAWGKLGNQSEVGNLCAAAEQDFVIDETQPYAELWMGTHPKGPLTVHGSGGILLSDYLKDHPEKIGKSLCEAIYDENSENGVQLPFLFKVLSVNKALSIQSHPTKEQAKKLHAEFPQHYSDDNHKPEMAIALSPFEMMCGFRPIEEIVQHIKSTPELFELIGGEAFKKLDDAMTGDSNDDVKKDALKVCFTALMQQPSPIVEKNIQSLTERVALAMNGKQPSDPEYILGELLIRLNFSFPGDVGCFAPFFLNHFVLQPGEACFLGPNEIHAYLYGDCIECMACSDNTIRAGLSPKFKDVQTLCDSLTYRMATAESNKLLPVDVVSSSSCLINTFEPEAPEFKVLSIQHNELGKAKIDSISSCSIIIVIQGSAKVTKGSDTEFEIDSLSRGIVGFIPAETSVEIEIVEAPFLAFQAYTSADRAKEL